MNNQCVPSWDLDDPVGAGVNPVSAEAMSDHYYEVAELTWEKGSISSQGLFNRPALKSYPPASSQLHAIGSSGGLEAVVGEAAARSLWHPAPWIGVGVAAVAARAPADLVVPCARDDAAEGEARLVGEDGRLCASQGSVAPGRGESTLLTLEACGTTGVDDVCGFTTTTNNSTSLDREDLQGSPETEDTSIGGGASDSRCFSRRPQRDGLCDEDDNVVIKGHAAVRSSITSKRSRAAAIHNESERKRRDRINQKMQTLQKLVPNSSKTDKASMLDEVIEHLKQLQAQVQMMNRMSSMNMMMPMAMPQLQIYMAQMAQMAQMGLGMMNMSPLAQPGYAGLTTPMMHPPAAFVPMPWDAAGDRTKQAAGSAVPDAYSAFLACQAAQQNAQQQPQQPISMEAYNRMVAMYQRLSQQQSQLGSSKQ